MQRPAEGDIHLLEAATDAENRHSGLDCLADERQRGRIACRIMQRAGGARGPLIPVWLDVRGTAGEEESVELLEQLIELELLGKGGDKERRGARRLHHGARIL